MKEYNSLATKFLIPQRLKTIREDKKISQKQAASSLKICSSTLSQYESGKRKPSASMLMELSDLYGESTDCLLGKAPYPSKSPEITAIKLMKIYPPISGIFDELCDLDDSKIKEVLTTLYPVFSACVQQQKNASSSEARKKGE